MDDWKRKPVNNMCWVEPFEACVAVGMNDASGSVQGVEFLNAAFILVSVYTATL